MTARGRVVACLAAGALLGGGAFLWWRWGDAAFVASLGAMLC